MSLTSLGLGWGGGRGLPAGFPSFNQVIDIPD